MEIPPTAMVSTNDTVQTSAADISFDEIEILPIEDKQVEIITIDDDDDDDEKWAGKFTTLIVRFIP